MEGWNYFKEEWLFKYLSVLWRVFSVLRCGHSGIILDYIISRLTYWNGPEKLVPPLDIGPLPHLFPPLNRILSFFPSTFASKPPIYKAGTAGVLGAEHLRGLRGSGLAAWGEHEEGTAAGVLADLMLCWGRWRRYLCTNLFLEWGWSWPLTWRLGAGWTAQVYWVPVLWPPLVLLNSLGWSLWLTSTWLMLSKYSGYLLCIILVLWNEQTQKLLLRMDSICGF